MEDILKKIIGTDEDLIVYFLTGKVRLNEQMKFINLLIKHNYISILPRNKDCWSDKSVDKFAVMKNFSINGVKYITSRPTAMREKNFFTTMKNEKYGKTIL